MLDLATLRSGASAGGPVATIAQWWPREASLAPATVKQAESDRPALKAER